MSEQSLRPGLWPVPGDGVLARHGDLILLSSLGSGHFVDVLLDLHAQIASSAGDGRRFTDAVADALEIDAMSGRVAAGADAEPEPAVLAFGPAGAGLAVTVSGAAWADVTTADGVQRIAAGQPGTLLRCLLRSPVIAVRGGLGHTGDSEFHTDRFSRLDAGTVRAGGLGYFPAGTSPDAIAAAARAARPTPPAAGPAGAQVLSAEPEPTEPPPAEPVELELAEPELTEPEPADFEPTEPEPTEPEPVSADPVFADSAPTEPEAADSAPAPDSAPAEPEAVDSPAAWPQPTEAVQIPDQPAWPQPAEAIPGPPPVAERRPTEAVPVPGLPAPAVDPMPPAERWPTAAVLLPSQPPAEPGGPAPEPWPPDAFVANPAASGQPPASAVEAEPFEAVLLMPGADLDVPPRGPLSKAQDIPQGTSSYASEGPIIEGVYCKNGHFDDPEALFCAVCGISMNQQTLVPRPGQRPPLGVLVLDDGSVFQLDNDYIIGREPSLDSSVAAGVSRPLRVADDSGIVSRVHARVQLEGWRVLITDLGSANGTRVKLPRQSADQALLPRVPLLLAPGCQIDLGGRGLRYESHRGR